MATITLKAGMVWRGAYDASVPYDKLDVVCNADKTQIAVCKQGGSGIPLTNSNYWEVSIDASGIIALLEDALAHGEIYTMKIGSVTTGASSSATIVNNHQTHETVLNLVLEKGEKGDKGDKGDRGEKGDTTVIDPSTSTTYTLYNQTGNHTDGAMTQDAVTKEFEKLDEAYARNDGYFETMGVGTATNLKGQNVVDAEFTYRKSGGNVEVQDGNAMIEAIKGNTIAWNQALTGTTAMSPLITFTDGVYTINGTLQREWNEGAIVAIGDTVIGHAYITHIKVIGGSCSNPNAKIYNGYEGTTSIEQGAKIFTPVGIHKRSLGIQGQVGDTFDNLKLIINSIDLTLIYGAGNEPTTPEQFEQDYFNWFGKPLTYEPYDAGSLRNTKVSALKTVGVNQWDEEWEEGSYHTWDGSGDGQKFLSPCIVRCKNFIRVLSGATYYAKSPRALRISFYDSEYNYLGFPSCVRLMNGTFVVPVGATYLAFYVDDIDYPTYNHDICINISDVNRNGEYEPYKESTLPLDVTTLTGKLNGEGSSAVVFADGMGENDEIRIEGDVVKAYKRGTIVDMGDDLLFMYRDDNIFETGSASRIFKDNGNVISTKFIQKEAYANNLANNEMTTNPTFNNNDLCFKDTAHTGADLVNGKATWLSGTKLYLELAETEVYVLDDFSLPKLYPVANGGTEEQLSNSPNSLPATLSIRYGLNAAAFIQNAPKNYISKESMTNFLGNLGSAMGGTWSMVWNSSTNKYDFSFTQNRSVDVEQPIEDK